MLAGRLLGNGLVPMGIERLVQRVNPDARGFKVWTPAGVVRVTGTVFGVGVVGDVTRVDVAEGAVIASTLADSTSVSEGNWFQMGAGETQGPQARPDEKEVPDWVYQLRNAEAKAGEATYLPSLPLKND